MSSCYDYANSTMITENGDVIICGTTKSFLGENNNFYVAKLNMDGQLEWQQSLGDTGYEWGTSICQTNDGNYVILGQSNSFGAGSYDVCLMKIEQTVTDVIIEKKSENEKFLGNYPNPFNLNTVISFNIPSNTQVKLVVYNSIGQEVKTLVDEFQTAGYKKASWDGTDNFGSTVVSGIYFYSLQYESEIVTGKMLLLK